MSRPLAVIVLAAGLGTRTKVSFPKVLLPLCGRSLVGTVMHTVAELQPDHTVVVLHHCMDQVEAHLRSLPAAATANMKVVDQGQPRGTGHAVREAMEALPGFVGDVIVVYGDVPLISAETLRALRTARAGGAASILTAFASPPEGMGRILRNGDGDLLGVREQKDCSDEELMVEEFNAGFYCFDGELLPSALATLTPANAQGELYLTDTVEWFLGQGQQVHSVSLESADEVAGVNNLEDLAFVRQIMHEQICLRHLLAGVIIEDPGSTFIDQDVEIGANTQIFPCTVLRSGVRIGSGCEVGPFAHLRNDTVLEDGAQVGNFVEAKKTVLGAGAKAKHLTYLGDAVVGAKANIGAGTITANYDGKNKHQTRIGEGAFVGSGTVLVAPVDMGQNSMTGAGAIVTKNTSIDADEVYVGLPARRLRKKGDPS